MTGMSLFRSALALSVLALFVSCAEIETPPTTNAPAPTPIPGYWNGDGVPGSPKIVVNITRQRAYFFKGKQLVGESTVSTGKKGFSTPPGAYQVLSKDKDHVSTVFGDYVDDFGNVVKSNIDSRKDSKPPGSHYDGARMPYAMFFRGGYAMHQGYVPPYAASHGCIRVPQGMADIFFDNAPVGTPVLVKESPGETYSRVEPDQGPPSVPVPLTVPPPAPNLVRSTAPSSVRPASIRSTVPAPTPVPVRSPAAVLSRAPAPVPSPSPAAIRSSPPASVRPASVRSAVVAPTPIPVRSPAPTPTPVVSRTPAPATARPTPSPVPARHHRSVRSRRHVRSPAPSPTPTPTPAR
jgi:L,D-transpeptidase catalytic domain